MAEIRKRTVPVSSPEEEKPSLTARVKAEDRGNSFSVLEVARFVTLIVLVTGLLSYFVTGKDFHWGIRPSFTTQKYWKSLMTRPISLTDAELKAYDGTDPDKPIYLAVNGTIFDVTAGRRHYGPGGSYHFFAGADATRAFVTSCFQEDISPDIRGIELMFIPTSTPEIDAQFSSGELKARKEQERRQAKEKVQKQIKYWWDFFSNNPNYMTVGRVRREEGWETKGPEPGLCQKAQLSRPARKPPAKAAGGGGR